MKTLSFDRIIEKWTSKGLLVTVNYSSSYCGCVSPGDIISVSCRLGCFRFVASLCRVFDEFPEIHLDRLYMDGDKCLSRFTIHRYIAELK